MLKLETLNSKLGTLLVPLLAVAIFNINLLGRAQVWADIQGVSSSEFLVSSSPLPTRNQKLETGNLGLGAVVVETSFEPLPFEEAIEFFRGKIDVSPAEFDALAEAARAKAFTIAGNTGPVVRDTIRQILDRALTAGVTMDEFAKQAAEVLDQAGFSARRPHYWETVYRTNMQTSYQAGRWKQMTDPAVISKRPYIRYISARLPTSRPSHVEKHGLIYRADHAFWQSWMPPNGFNCYCTTMSVSESLLSRRGWVVSEEMNFRYPEPDDGFANNPGVTETV